MNTRSSGLTARSRLACSLLMLIAALGAACTKPAPTNTSEPGPVSVSSESATVTVTLAIRSSRLKASTTETATLSMTNSSDATVSVATLPRLVIFDAATGELVYQSSPEAIRLLIEMVPFAPGAMFSRQIAFPVPEPGKYTLEAYYRRTGRPVRVPFESVR